MSTKKNPECIEQDGKVYKRVEYVEGEIIRPGAMVFADCVFSPSIWVGLPSQTPVRYYYHEVKEPELVAVMLPKTLVKSGTLHGVRDPSGRMLCGFKPELAEVFGAACRKALRPKPPTDAHLYDLTCDELSCADAKSLREWIEHVLEHGWEAESCE